MLYIYICIGKCSFHAFGDSSPAHLRPALELNSRPSSIRAMVKTPGKGIASAIHVCMWNIYIYIYVHIHTKRERQREREGVPMKGLLGCMYEGVLRLETGQGSYAYTLGCYRPR